MKDKEQKTLKSFIKPISYVCSFDNDSRISTVSNEFPIDDSGLVVERINISAKDFGDAVPLGTLNEKWFLNLSGIHIPEEVRYLLQLGEGFGLPIDRNNLQHTFIEFIKSIESNIINRPNNVINVIRNNTMPILEKFHNDFPKSDSNTKLLSSWTISTKKFIKEHPELLFSKADKGNVTVALNRDDYVNKMELMLSDENTYEIISKDPTRKIINDSRNILVRWKNKGFIDNITYKNLLSTDGSISRAYGLTKIHKTNYPLRIIVSSVNSPLYNLSLYLHKIINNSIQKSPSYIRNSVDLIDKLKNIKLESNSILVSLDVVSLFTNIPMDLATNSVVRRWEFISSETKITLEEFMIAFRLVLNSTVFIFNGKYYKQIFGTPMGSPLSPIVADMVMQDLEETALGLLPVRLSFYYQYVDDVILAAPSESIDDILCVFNSLHTRLQFTMEVGIDGKISFLDTLIIVEDCKLIFDGYRKATFSGRFLNFHSQHPICHKRGVIWCHR
ncbi:PREDICTED: uncharacterized protein LOC108763996 [Trachymyrmex cornetzi]|uniref:uncharacterized protein LOC108763996 n=1 Tax=Trachymyrmex cornetzi TaxID=471704 RepID=UPI00084EDD5D|nr:PREDICTED: uncharacterized protein LOC108763996 [Trachymyrmex cornetzi]